MKRFADFSVVVIVLLAVIVPGLAAQQNPIAILAYFDDEQELRITDSNDFTVSFYLGMGLSPGDRIETGNTAVEIQLDPNGSIMRIAANSDVQIDALLGRSGASSHQLAVKRGRFRMIAARFTDRQPHYQIRTPSAVVGVRGTDFGVHVVPLDVIPEADSDQPTPQYTTETEELFVFDGEAIFTNTVTGTSVFVESRQRVDIHDPDLLPLPMQASDISQRRSGLEFQQLDPNTVPGIVAEPETVTVEVEPEPEPEKETVEDAPGYLDRVFTGLAEISALEVGSLTLNENTFARISFQPSFSIGELAVALNFPIIYGHNLFNGTTWYRPGGNNEWSFSSDQDWTGEPLVALRDFGTDVALKIRTVEYAERGDPFFITAGTFSSFTLGQGLLMRNYANDTDYPTVRRVGFISGIDTDEWGLEIVVNDVTAPEVYAGRIFFRPAEPVLPAAVGISAVTDTAPAGYMSLQDRNGAPLPDDILAVFTPTRDGDPLFLSVAVDIELPIVDRERFDLTGFAEAGGLVPYLREQTTLGSEQINSGLKTSALVDFSSGDLKNVGWTIGARGRASTFDYLLEFRSYDGIFQPGFYGPGYDRLRGTYAANVIRYLANTEAVEYQTQTMGVAVEAETELGDLFRVSAGYFFPWERTEDRNWQGSDDDEITLDLASMEGLIPLGITAGIAYRRRHFAATVAGWHEYADAYLVDAYTTVEAYARCPLSETVDLESRVSTAVLRSDKGDIIYNRSGAPRIAPVLAIQTRFGF